MTFNLTGRFRPPRKKDSSSKSSDRIIFTVGLRFVYYFIESNINTLGMSKVGLWGFKRTQKHNLDRPELRVRFHLEKI